MCKLDLQASHQDNGIKNVGELVSSNQTAFMPGRSITDNTLLVEEMLEDFGRARTPRRVCISVDIKKAFDSLNRDVILATLQAMGEGNL